MDAYHTHIVFFIKSLPKRRAFGSVTAVDKSIVLRYVQKDVLDAPTSDASIAHSFKNLYPECECIIRDRMDELQLHFFGHRIRKHFGPYDVVHSTNSTCYSPPVDSGVSVPLSCKGSP